MTTKITATELMKIATRLANQAHVRYWLHWNYPREDPWVMAIQAYGCAGHWGEIEPIQIPDLVRLGFEWDDEDLRYYIDRDTSELILSGDEHK